MNMKWVVNDGLDEHTVKDSSELDRLLEELREEGHKAVILTAVLSCGREVEFQYLLKEVI